MCDSLTIVVVAIACMFSTSMDFSGRVTPEPPAFYRFSENLLTSAPIRHTDQDVYHLHRAPADCTKLYRAPADPAKVEPAVRLRDDCSGARSGDSRHRRGRRAGRRLQQRRAGPQEADRRWINRFLPEYDRALIQLPRSPTPERATGPDPGVPIPAGHRVAGTGGGGGRAADRRSAGEAAPPQCRGLPTGRPAAVCSDGAAATPASATELPAGALQPQQLPDQYADRVRPQTDRSRGTAHIQLHVLNVQSLLPKLPDIAADVTETEPHILCYTETNLRSSTPNRLITIPGYENIHRSDRKLGRKKCGGGVAILTRNTITANTIMKTSELNGSHMETVWVKLKLDQRRSIVSACIYRSPDVTVVQNEKDFDELERQVGDIIQRYTPSMMIISGDFNADTRTNPAGAKQLTQLVSKFEMRVLVHEPTFYRGETASTLDNILLYTRTTQELTAECIVEKCDYTTEHRKLVGKIAVPRYRRPRAVYRRQRDWRRLEVTQFRADLDAINWGRTVPRSDSCQTQWDKFVHAVESVLDHHAPMKMTKIRNPAPPPITDDTRDLIIQRRQAIAEEDKERYSMLNSQVKRAIRQDYRSDIQRRVEGAPPSALWRQLRPVVAPKRVTPTQPDNLTAEELNRYFTTVGEETYQSVISAFQKSGRRTLAARLPRVHSDALQLVPISLEELRNIIGSLPNKSSPADEVIDTRVMKLIFPVIGRILLQIINKSIVTEEVPDSWKMAVVIPIHKKGDNRSPENFRPITNVPTISKVIEKAVCTQVDGYLSRNHVFSPDQHGFRHKHSTATALISVNDRLLEAADRGDICILTLIDLSRAFDLVDHQTLLNQLQMLQISPGWFRNYLSGHRQCVQVAGERSELRPITTGIFQGSCMGPSLYNIATNSAACYVPSEVNGFAIEMVRYADDTQLVISGPRDRLPEMQDTLEGVLDTLANYFLQNGMKINAAKTELMLAGGRAALQTAENEPVRVQFLGATLQPVSTVRNLGVIFDERLTFEPHIDHVVNKCFGILIGLMHAKHVLPAHVLPVILDALVMSHVRYCSQVFGCASQTALKRLQKVQNFAARVISGRRKYEHISDVIRDLAWLPIGSLVDMSDMCLLHRVIRTSEPEMLRRTICYNREVAERRTRQSDHLYIPRARTNLGQRRFVHRACKLYNEHVVGTQLESMSYENFKKSLKALLLLD